ncbi:MAG: caffeoyl-CoA O-methyltransferase [Arcticibacterium sp.]|jgi:caffeoyl-CoA O-methyltransferase
MLIINSEAEAYCTSISQAEPSVLKEIRRDTYVNVMQPRMLSGHFQGRLLSLISNLMRPYRVLEIGTYTGYSSICLAEGLSKDGKVISIDVNEELQDRIKTNFDKAGKTDKINFMAGDAAHIIPELNETFDLVFIDADKRNYQKYFDLVIDKVKIDGLIISDNVLWDGKVFDPEAKDLTTKALRKYNLSLKENNRIQTVLLPIRDGLLVARKIS